MKQILENGNYFGEILSKRGVDKLILSETFYNPNSVIPKHCHKNLYFCSVLGGEYLENSHKKETLCFKGDIIIHPKFYEHSNIFNEKGGVCFNIEFTNIFQDEMQGVEINCYNIFKKETQPLSVIINKVYNEYKNYDEFSNIIIEGLMFEALGLSARVMQRSHSDYWFNKAKEMILDSKDVRISLSSIAAELNISSSHLAREFKMASSITIGEYIRNTRIQKICKKLMSKNVDMLTISIEYGFSDLSHLNKVFKKVLGITPRQYVDNYKQNHT
ncbi:MAG TPA: helix-turn-helix transcriptional regulator [Chitinophagaceae bacterium]|nr:helix-turn-helix transcriptional regulator [Chitinophagaceae bacterium]